MTGLIEITKWIYETTRIEAKWSKRRIIPEKWEVRSQEFREQFTKIIKKYFEDELPTPKEAHNSWIEAYEEMGWRYGNVRDVKRKTHPDMIPFEDLPTDEQEKDAIFLSFIFLAKKLISEFVEKLEEEIKDCKLSLKVKGTNKSWIRGKIRGFRLCIGWIKEYQKKLK